MPRYTHSTHAPPLVRTHPCVVTAQYKEVVVRVNSEQFAEFDHVLIDVNQVR